MKYNKNTIYDNGYPPPGKNYGTAPLVMGIISIGLWWLGWFSLLGFILAIIGIFMAIRARKLMPPGTTGRATVALVLCVIGLLLSMFGFVSCVLCYGYYPYDYYDYYYWW